MTDIERAYMGVIERAMAAHPRSQQKRIGPSEIGNPCDRAILPTELHIAPPGFLFDRWRHDQDVPGFPRDTDLGKADVLLSELIRFELTHSAKIAALDTIIVWYEELADMIRTLRGQFPVDPPPVRPRQVRCPVCDEARLVITRTVDDVETIRCDYCKWTPTSDVETDDVLTEGAAA